MRVLFGKKKLTINQLSNIFVNSLMNTVENGFVDIAAIINEAPELKTCPGIQVDNIGHFGIIVFAGNLKHIPLNFDMVLSKDLIELTTTKMAKVFNMDVVEFAKVVTDYKSFMSRINHPSKNIMYSMSKAVVYKYNIIKYEDDFFKNKNVPNPILLKRLNEIMSCFIWDWDNFLKKYKITE